MTLQDIREFVFDLKDQLGCTEVTLKVDPVFLNSLPQAIATDNQGIALPESGESIVINIVSNTGNVNNRKYPIREIVIVK